MRTISKTTTTHYVPLDVQKSAMNYDETFVAARANKKEKMDRCFRCNWPFQITGDGELVSVVAFKGRGNKLVCEDCANWILGDEQEGSGDE